MSYVPSNTTERLHEGRKRWSGIVPGLWIIWKELVSVDGLFSGHKHFSSLSQESAEGQESFDIFNNPS